MREKESENKNKLSVVGLGGNKSEIEWCLGGFGVVGGREGEGCGGERILERKIFFLDFLIFLDFLRFLKGSPLPRFLH